MQAKFIPATAVALAILLGACESRQERTRIEPLPNHIPPGSTFTLNQEITLPADNVPLYFQDTQLLPKDSLEADFPHCEFRGAEPSPQDTPVAPQVMSVTATTFDDRSSSTGAGVVSVTSIELHSTDTGSHFRITCAPAGPTRSAEFATTEEIIGALGGYFKVELAS